MRTRQLPTLLLAIVFLVAGVLATWAGAPATRAGGPAIQADGSQLHEVGRVDSRLEGGVIPMYTSWDNAHSAVAYSTDSEQYLYVYQSVSGAWHEIRGRFINASSGNLVGSSFALVSSSTRELDHPDVAYNPYLNVFLVVWEQKICSSDTNSPDLEYCNFEIRGRYLYGEQSDSSQFVSNSFTLASQRQPPNYNDLRDPAIAYNADDKNFLIVFLRDEDGLGNGNFTDVFGQMINGETVFKPQDQLSFPLEGFSIRSYNTYKTSTPDVAWGSDGDYYVATWGTDPLTKLKYATACYIHDTYQSGSDQGESIWKVTYSLPGDAQAPAIAYDNENKAYVVVFEYVPPATMSSPQLTSAGTEIRGQRMRPDYDESDFRKNGEDTFVIDDEAAYADVTYYGDPDITEAGRAGEMRVIYQTLDLYYSSPNQYFIHGRDLRGTTVGDSLTIRDAETDETRDPTIACHDGYCLAAWTEMRVGESKTWGILGQRLAPDCYTLNLSVSPPGSGSVQATAANCGSGRYLEGTQVIMIANPAGDYSFLKWSGDVGGTGAQQQVEVLSDMNIVANFSKGGGADYKVYLPFVKR